MKFIAIMTIVFGLLLGFNISTGAAANDFLTNISTHYDELLTLSKTKNYQHIIDKADEFRKHFQMNYKNVRDIWKAARTELLFEKIKKTPDIDYTTRLSLYSQLKTLNPQNLEIKDQYDQYFESYCLLEKDVIKGSEKLHLLDWQWHEDGRHAVARGRIRNSSDDVLEFLSVEVEWYDKNNKIIIARKTLIPNEQLLPGQATFFKITEDWTRKMKKASAKIKNRSGKVILSTDKTVYISRRK